MASSSVYRPVEDGPKIDSRLHCSQLDCILAGRITARQIECLGWVQEGKSASDIGGILGISARTVEGHLLKVCDHLGVKTRLQAVLKAHELGLIGPPAP